MAIFPVSGTSGANITALKNALISAGAITTLFYEQVNNTIIFSSPYSDKIIKITNGGSAGFSLFMGDAWTSTTTITNSVTIFNPYIDTFNGGSHALIKTPDTLSICIAGNSDSFVIHFTKFTNGHFVVICTASSQNTPASYMARVYNTTVSELLYPTFVATRMLSDTGYYHQYNPQWKTNGNVYRNYQLTATLRILTRSANLGTQVMYEQSGNDIIVPFECIRDTILQVHNTCAIILNGAL